MGARRALRRQLLMDRPGLHLERVRFRLARRKSAAPRPPALAPRDEDGDRHANLQRSAVAGLLGGSGDLRGRRGDRPRRRLRLFLPLRHHRPEYLDRRGARAAGDARALARRANLLPSPAQERQPQGRQYRRFRHALGRRLSANGRARRRQSDDRRRDRAARRDDGGRSRCGDHSEPAADRQSQYLVRQSAAIRRAHRRPDHRRRPRRLDGARRQLLGPQRDHPHARLRRPLRPAESGRASALRRPHPEPRFRRSGADASGRLRRLHAADAGRLVRGEPAVADRSGGARPALVPGQPATHSRAAEQGVRPRQPPAFLYRHHGLSRLAPVDGAIAHRHRAGAAVQVHPAGIFHRRLLAVPGVASLRLPARLASVRSDDRGAARA